MHAFFASPYFAGLSPVKGALETLRAHADHCRFVVVTSRQHSIEDPTRAWLDAHFPGVFSGVAFGNHWGPHGSSKRSKADMCRDVDAALLIDDNPAYAAEVAREAGISALLFGEYAWNETPLPLPAGVVRAVSWAHVSALLGRLREGAGADHGSPSPLHQPPLPTLVVRGRSAQGSDVPALAEVEALEAAAGLPLPLCAAWCAAAVTRVLESQARVTLVASSAHADAGAVLLREAIDILQRQGVALVVASVDPAEPASVVFERAPGFLRSRFGGAESERSVAEASRAAAPPA